MALVEDAGVSDREISDAYGYVLGRLLIMRQQRLDFDDGFAWNTLVHRKPGEVAWPNPNLDVAYSEAWVAVDEAAFLLVTVPQVVGRYYTVQFLNGWGETVANINERVFPNHASGTFAVCLAGSEVVIPEGAIRVDVPVKYMRVLTRVELAADWDAAIDLQHQFFFETQGEPTLADLPDALLFDGLPGVESFEAAKKALDSEADINPGMERLQQLTRVVAQAVQADPEERQRVDEVIRTVVWRDLAAAQPLLGHGVRENGWSLPSTSGSYGDDWLTRTLINLGGIWANTPDEVVYYKGFVDGSGAKLENDRTYTLTFPDTQLPARYADYFWSVIAVDAVQHHVLPNPLNRYLLNNQSDLAYADDGSLTLVFAPERPDDVHDGNWLPTSGDQGYSLTFRFYGPKDDVAARSYFPPPLTKKT